MDKFKRFKEGEKTTFRIVKKYTNWDDHDKWWDWETGFADDVVITQDRKFLKKKHEQTKIQ